MVARHSHVQIREQLAVLCKIIRNVVRLEVVVDAFIRSALSLENGDFLDEVEGE